MACGEIQEAWEWLGRCRMKLGALMPLPKDMVASVSELTPQHEGGDPHEAISGLGPVSQLLSVKGETPVKPLVASVNESTPQHEGETPREAVGGSNAEAEGGGVDTR